MTPFATGETAAGRAVAALRGNGYARNVRLLISGCTVHDPRRERVGGFAGPVAPDDSVESFANRSGERRRGCGSLAGELDGHRQGRFADTNRVVMLTRREAPSGLA
jgi:hypothetical protein